MSAKEFNEAFRAGYNAGTQAANPSLHSSNMWEAFELGRWFHHTGRNICDIRKARGYSWHCGNNGFIATFVYHKGGSFKIERTA